LFDTYVNLRKILLAIIKWYNERTDIRKTKVTEFS